MFLKLKEHSMKKMNKKKMQNKRYVILAEELPYVVITPNNEDDVNSKWYIDNYKENAWAYSNPLSADELAKYLTYEFELGINTIKRRFKNENIIS